MLLGLDVSHWDGVIDWKIVLASGYKFAYTKATESITYTDDTLVPNVTNAIAVGMPIGAYHFYRLAADPKAQADYFLSKIKGLKLDLPPSLDFEEQASLPQSTVAQNLKIWLDTVEAGVGRKPIIYTNAYYWNTYAGTPSWAKDYGLWVANYTSAPAPLIPKGWTNYLIWQYTDKGSVPGISADVDLDRFTGDEQALAKLAGRTFVPAAAAAPTLSSSLEDRVKALESQVKTLQDTLKAKGLL
jgi:lysozyme